MANMSLEIVTTKKYDYLNIKPQILEFIAEAGVKNGLVVAQTTNTTTGFAVNEEEKGLLEGRNGDIGDIPQALERLAPSTISYLHDHYDRMRNLPGEPINGAAHIQAMLLERSAIITITDGEANFGNWMSVIFMELDGPRGDRKVVVQIQGITE